MAGEKVPEVVSVQMNVNSSEGNVILGRQTYKLVGHQTLRDMIGETRLAISPASFSRLTMSRPKEFMLWCANGRN